MALKFDLDVLLMWTQLIRSEEDLTLSLPTLTILDISVFSIPNTFKTIYLLASAAEVHDGVERARHADISQLASLDTNRHLAYLANINSAKV